MFKLPLKPATTAMLESARVSQTAVILTALGVETKAVLRHLTNVSTETVSGTGFFKGQFEGWDIAVVEAGAGNSSAAAITTRACEYYKPKVALLIGVAGGMKDVAIGHVVVATKVYGYESGKDKVGGFQPRPDLLRSDHELEQRARIERQLNQWQVRLNPQLAHDNPHLHVGPIAAGEKVVASNRASTAKFLRKEYSDTLAVEMEGRGFLEGVHINHPVQGSVIRGISDLLSGKANADQNGSQERAADAASAVAFQLLSSLGNSLASAAPHNTCEAKSLEASDLKAMAASLLDTGTPPSMTMLFPGIPSAISAALDFATEVKRTVIEASQSTEGFLRTSITPLASMELRRHLILGPPGSGKTHALWHAANALLKVGDIIPLYLPAGQIDRWDDLASMLRQASPMLRLDDILRDQRVCVLIDGWSEFASGEYAGEKQKTLRALQNTRIIANGKASDVSDTPFKIWELEPLTLQQVADVLSAAGPAKPLLPGSLLDLLRLPLLLSIHILSTATAAETGDLLRQFHDHLARDLPEGFTQALAEAVATSTLSGDRSYGRLVAHLQSCAALKGIAEPARLLRGLGTITERNGQALPIHDLYWSWLSGRGLIATQSVEAAIDDLQTRESYRLALQSGTRPIEADIMAAVNDDLLLAAMLDAGLRASRDNRLLIAAIERALNDSRLAIRNRGGLAALERGSSPCLMGALNTLSALSSAKLYVSDWLQALRPEVLFPQRAVLADWIGSEGSEFVLDAIAERGDSEWVPWLEQMASAGKITRIEALSVALACSASIPAWSQQYLDELFRTRPWVLRAAALRRCNHALARHIAAEYERLVDIIPKNSSGWINLNQMLVNCGDDAVFEFLLGHFGTMTKRAQELLGFAVVDRGQPWISAFQRVAFAKPAEDQHHKLAEILSPQIEDATARAWINAGHYEMGWRVLIARHGAAVLPELISDLPNSFAGVSNIPSLAAMRFLDQSPASLIDELMKRLGSPMQPKVTQDVLNAMETVYPTGVPIIIQLVSQQPNNFPVYHIAQTLRLYRAWRERSGSQSMIQLTTGESIEFSRWIAKHCALHRWDDHLVPQMLSLLPDLAIEVVLSHLKSDVGKSASVLAALKDLSSYNADLVEYMLSVPKLTELIPSVFANAFDTFPVEALHRCIESPCINQETLLFRLGTTSNPLHRSIHAELIHRVLNAPTNLHHYRYVANMLRGHTTEDTDFLLRNAEGVGSDNWLWLVREVEAARGERLINEAGELRRKQDIKSATTNLAGAEPQDTEASRAITKKPTQLLKKYWHDPVWSKVIATVILALFALIASLLDLPDFKITKSQQLISPQLTSQNDLHKLDIQIRHVGARLKLTTRAR
jgi:nucleoside phosphorylase